MVLFSQQGWGLYAEYLGEEMGLYNKTALELLVLWIFNRCASFRTDEFVSCHCLQSSGKGSQFHMPCPLATRPRHGPLLLKTSLFVGKLSSLLWTSRGCRLGCCLVLTKTTQPVPFHKSWCNWTQTIWSCEYVSSDSLSSGGTDSSSGHSLHVSIHVAGSEDTRLKSSELVAWWLTQAFMLLGEVSSHSLSNVVWGSDWHPLYCQGTLPWPRENRRNICWAFVFASEKSCLHERDAETSWQQQITGWWTFLISAAGLQKHSPVLLTRTLKHKDQAFPTLLIEWRRMISISWLMRRSSGCRGTRRSSTSRTTPQSRAHRSRRRLIATSRGLARRAPTRWARGRSWDSGSSPKPNWVCVLSWRREKFRVDLGFFWQAWVKVACLPIANKTCSFARRGLVWCSRVQQRGAEGRAGPSAPAGEVYRAVDRRRARWSLHLFSRDTCRKTLLLHKQSAVRLQCPAGHHRINRKRIVVNRFKMERRQSIKYKAHV